MIAQRQPETAELADDGGSLRDAVPASGFITSLNSQDNLNREASAISNRVALASRYTGWASPIWDVPSDQAGPYMTGLTESTIAELLFAADYYRNYGQYADPDYWVKLAYWEDWLRAAAPLVNLDNAWCTWTGAIDQGEPDHQPAARPARGKPLGGERAEDEAEKPEEIETPLGQFVTDVVFEIEDENDVQYC